MRAIVLDGKTLARQIESELSVRVRMMRDTCGGKTPILATILVGGGPASQTYVRMKGNACRRVGMGSLPIILPEDTTTDALLHEIDKLNTDRDVHGILL